MFHSLVLPVRSAVIPQCCQNPTLGAVFVLSPRRVVALVAMAVVGVVTTVKLLIVAVQSWLVSLTGGSWAAAERKHS